MYKILSVDDEPINQIIVEELLGTEFDISLVSSGEECLEEIDRIKPDLILMDVSMPGIDGYQTCRELKLRQSTQHIPVVFVSALSSIEDMMLGYEAGGYDYISKPFNHFALENKIKDTITNLQASITAEKVRKQSLQAGEKTSFSPNIQDFHYSERQFIDACQACEFADELGQLLLKLCFQQKLECTFQLRLQTSHVNFSTSREILPLEVALLNITSDPDRFFAFKTQMLLSYPHLSLLIKNLPQDKAAMMKETKSFLCNISSAAEARLQEFLNDRPDT
jgi:CheY-like chemotaxis protein